MRKRPIRLDLGSLPLPDDLVELALSLDPVPDLVEFLEVYQAYATIHEIIRQRRMILLLDDFDGE